MGAREGGGQPAGTGASFDILTVLGHDLKSPLNSVEAYLEIIRGRVLGEGLDSYTAILDNSIARLQQMRELITDVVDWSKLRQASPDRPPAAADVSKIVRAVIERYGKEAQSRGITIETDIDDGLVMDAAAREMELMVRHLVDNALKYNRENGTVRVTVKRAGTALSLIVADTGIGMEADDQARLFGEFVRIRNEKTADIRGTGLGLAIVRLLVERCKGTVAVESEPDRGTAFTLTFPCGG